MSAMDPNHDELRQYLDLCVATSDEADFVDPVTHADAVGLLQTAQETGHIFGWGISVGTGASFRPVSQVLTDQHLYDIEVNEDERRPVIATKIVTFIRGLLDGDTRADIAALRAEHGVDATTAK